MGDRPTPGDHGAPATEGISVPDGGRPASAPPALDAHIRALIAARNRARRAITAARRGYPERQRRRERALARLSRRLAVARRDRTRQRTGRGPQLPAPARSARDDADRGRLAA